MNKLLITVATLILTLEFAASDFRFKADLVDGHCMNCLCYAMTGCNSTLKCNKGVCGMYKISWPYWADGEKPLIDENDDPDSGEAFENCAIDRKCSERAVQGYMKKYRQDCNGDGNIDCYDYAAIHKLGGYGCKYKLPEEYSMKIDECLTAAYASA